MTSLQGKEKAAEPGASATARDATFGRRSTSFPSRTAAEARAGATASIVAASTAASTIDKTGLLTLNALERGGCDTGLPANCWRTTTC
jgi:hypothetical protein